MTHARTTGRAAALAAALVLAALSAPAGAETPVALAPASKGAVKPPPAEPQGVLRHLPNNIQGFRLSGEIGASEWPFYLSDAQTRSALKFRVGFLSSVSVMPEASRLTVSINDVVIGTTEVSAANAVRTVEFDVPPRLVKPGFNAVRIAVDQRHRVECSLESTFELWTQIDSSQTGLILPAAVAGAIDPEQMAALPPDAEGAMPVRAVMVGKVESADVERAILAVQMIAASGHFEQPIVDVGPMAGGQYGVNLIIGRYGEIGDLPGVSDLGLVAGPRVAILPATENFRTTVVITGQSEDEVNQALLRFGKPNPMRGAEPGVRAARAFPGYRVNPGEKVRLADLGLRSQEFTGHYFHTAFNIIMPADFYSADYARVPLDLAGGYGAGLMSSAQVIVAINGRNAVSAALPRADGDVFKDMTLPLPLGELRPGLNRIEIFAQLPMESDANCDPLSVIQGGKRFLFLDSTSIEIPNLARIGRVPDLSVTATGAFPYLGGERRPNLFTPSPDRESIGAAATIAARMAASAGATIPFRFTTTPPAIGAGATLMVAPANRIDDTMLGAFDIDAKRLRNTWGDRISGAPGAAEEDMNASDQRARNRIVMQKNLPGVCPLRWREEGKLDKRTTGAIAAAPTNADGDSGSILKSTSPPDLYDSWSRDLKAQSPIRHWTSELYDQSLNAWRDLVGRARKGADEFAIAPLDGADPLDVKDNQFLMAQAALGPGVDSVWTLATAPNPRLLAQSADCLTDPRVWAQVRGRMALLDASQGSITSVEPASMTFVSTEPFSPTNLRLVAAGWLSLNRTVYVALTVAVGFLLAYATLQFVRNVGRRQS
jgi:cellulose synthase operon protein B